MKKKKKVFLGGKSALGGNPGKDRSLKQVAGGGERTKKEK